MDKGIIIRLGVIQKNLVAPKSNINEFGKYKYRSCEDILTAVKPLLEDGECVTLTDEIVQIGDRYYLKATATFHSMDKSISSTAYAREPENKKGMDEAQITGSTSSYSRKYALNGLFAIDDTKDPDATNKHGKDKPQANKKQIEEYELELEAAFNEGRGAEWWKANAKQAKKDCPKDFSSLEQLKDVLKLKKNKVSEPSGNSF